LDTLPSIHKMNTITPIHTLPLELLTAIFSILTLSYHDHQTLYILVPAVCTRWRDICLTMSNLPITFAGTDTNMMSYPAQRPPHLHPCFLPPILKRFHSFSSVTLNINSTAPNIDAVILSSLPRFAATLKTLRLTNAICTPTDCYLRLITALCVNLDSLHITTWDDTDCHHAEFDPASIKCTKLTTLTCNYRPVEWLQNILATIPLHSITIYSHTRYQTHAPLVFHHPAALRKLCADGYFDILTPDQHRTTFEGMHNLEHLEMTPTDWVSTTDAIRTECPNLRSLIVNETWTGPYKLNLTVFQTGFANLRVFGTTKDHGRTHYSYYMLSALRALPALTHFVTSSTINRDIATAVLPHVKCLTWQQWNREDHAHR
jgi:hypothetical protein